MASRGHQKRVGGRDCQGHEGEGCRPASHGGRRAFQHSHDPEGSTEAKQGQDDRGRTSVPGFDRHEGAEARSPPGQAGPSSGDQTVK